MKDNGHGNLRTVFRTILAATVFGAAFMGLAGAVNAQVTNDNFAQKLVLTGSFGTTNTSTTGYTAEPSEPGHAGFPAQASAWFQWTAPVGGLVQFDTYGSGFDTILAVYTGGSDVGKLDFVVANDDATPANQSAVGTWFGPSLVRFNAKQGQTYFIAVDGYRGASGALALSWSYHSAGVFRFTTDSYAVSERDGQSPIGAFSGNVEKSVQGARVTVTRVGGASGRATVDLTTVDGAAVAGLDYIPVTTTLVFNDWEMSKSVIIPVLSDPDAFDDLDFSVQLSNPQLDPLESTTIQPPRVDPDHSVEDVTLLNFDLDPANTNIDTIANFDRSTYRTREDSGSVTIYVYRQGNKPDQRKIAWAIDQVGGVELLDNRFGLEAASDYATPDPVTASPPTDNPVDFQGPYSGVITWGQGDFTPKAITFPINNDTVPEFNEDIKLRLYGTGDNDSAAPGDVSEATVTILYDDYPAGALDASHNPDFDLVTDPPQNATPGANGTVYSSAIQADGRCLIAGDFTTYNTVTRNRVARMNVDGSNDSTFNPGSGANDFVSTLALQTDGKIVIGGGFTSFNGQFRSRVARLNTDGSVDGSFNPGLGADNTVWASAVQTDGKVVIGGEFTSVNGASRYYIARLNADGSVDSTFNPTNALNGPVEAIAVSPGGAIYVGGRFTMAGAYSRNSVARLNADGSLDLTFDPRTGVNGPVYALALQGDGRLLVGGAFDTVDLRARRNLARFNTDGTLDTAFDLGAGVDDTVYAIQLSGTGRIYIGGAFLNVNQTRRAGVARLYPNGQVDTSFMDTAYNQFAGIPTHYSTEVDYPAEPRNFLLTLAVQTDGNLIIGGSFHQVGGGRLHPNIQTNDFDFAQTRYDEGVEGTYGYSRQSYRNRYNVARLLGGNTDGPGNVGFLTDTYSIDESAGFVFIKTLRENGTLGVAETTFSLPPGTGGTGLAQTTTDYTYNHVNPLYDTTWGMGTRNLADGIFGTNNVGLTVLQNSTILSDPDDIYVTIPRNPGIQGDRTAQLQLDAPMQADIFFLGGENVPLGNALARTTASLQINDVDNSPGVIGFSAPTYTVNENGTNAVITLTRTNGSSGPVSVVFSTADGTATSANYSGLTNTISFGQGVTNRTVLIPIKNDSTIQSADRTILLTLKSAAGGATLGLTNAVLSIIDDDFPPGRINFTAVAAQTNEYAGHLRVMVSRTGGNLGVLDVQCRTVNGTAVDGVNYTGLTNTLHWDSGDISPRTVDVVLLPDGIVTPDLNFNVRLSNPSIPGALGVRTNIAVTIANEDFYGAPQFTLGTYYVDETAGYATITVVRSGGNAQTISVNYATSDGTAVSSGPLPNYTSTAGTLVFGPGVVSQSFTVPILNDGVADPSSFFFGITLSGVTPGGAVLGSPSTTQVRIVDAQSFNQPAGSVDPGFDAGIGFNGSVFSLARQPGGSIVAGGDFTTVNGLPRNRLARVLTNGVEDSVFMAGLSGANGPVRSVICQSDTRLLVGGQFTTFNNVSRNYLTRLNTDGSLDTTFDPGSGADAPVFSLAEGFVGGARKLYVGGNFTTFNGFNSPGLVRLNDNGTVDPQFDLAEGVNGPVYAIVVYPTNTINAGKVVIGGAFSSVNGVARAGIARLNPDGSLDATFDPGAGANAEVRALALQSDGKIVLGGAFTSVAGQPFSHLARLNLNGSADGGFAIGVGANDSVYALAIQADNRIVVGGEFVQASGVTRRRITRLMPDGTVDPTINFGSGANGFVDALVVQPDGNLVMGGGFTAVQGQTANHIARLFGGSMTGSGQVEFTAPLYVVNENGTNVVVTLHRLGGTSGTGVNGTGNLTVNFQTGDITAVAGVNYLGVTQQVSFPVGEVETTITVPVIQDYQITSDLLATLSLDGAAGTLGPQPTALLDIVNVDSAVRFSAATYVRNEDAIDGVATITILRQGSTQGTASVIFNTTTNGTAVAGVNYLPTTNTVAFQAGETSRTVTIPVLRNTAVEGDKTVNLELSTPVGTVLLNPSQAVLTIHDVDQAPGQFVFGAPAYAFSESATNAMITVLRSNGFSGIVSVNINTLAGTAVPGIRYVSTNAVLSFADGQTNRTFLVPLINDNVVQGDQTFTVQLSNPTGGATLGGSPSVPVTVLDDDVAMSFTSPAYVVNETNALVSLGVQRLNGSNSVSTVTFRTADGTAVAGTNYTAENRVLTFNVGETFKSVSVAIQRDPRVTGNLSFFAALTNASAGVQLVAPNPASVVIVDNDPGISFTNVVQSVLENATNLAVTVVCSNAGSGAVTVNYATEDGTAVAGQDYVATSGTLMFTNGQTEQTIIVPITDNKLPQPDRNFTISLFNATGGAQVLNPGTLTATIVDNDAGLQFSTAAYRVVESGVNATITVLRTNYTNSLVTVDYGTRDGSAHAPGDYAPTSGTLVFTNGETAKTFTVGLKDDSILTGDRTVLLTLSNAVGDASIVSPGAATLTISDDDGSLIIPAGTALVSESTNNGVVDPGETLTVLFGFRNSAGTNAQNVTATLLATNGITPVTTSQNYGAMVVGAPVTARPFTFVVNATNGQTIAATFDLSDNGAPIGRGVFTFGVGTATFGFTNSSPIIITDRGASTSPVGANPYPSTINVSGVEGGINQMSITFSNFSHVSVGDVGALLVSPAGQKTLLMANDGGFNSVSGLTLQFDDGATNGLPLGTAFGSGVYKPTSYAPLPPFPAPAPGGAYSNALSAFAGSNPNGVWSLYVIDDTSPGAGVISNGWWISITRGSSIPSASDLSLGMAATPQPAIAGAQLAYTLWVTNNGPATANTVSVTDTLPAGAQYVSGTTATGTVTNQSGTVTWSVGSLANGATASLSLVVIPSATGSLTNTAVAASGVSDLYPENNTVTSVSAVTAPTADLVLGMTDTPDPVVAGWPLTYQILVTNLGPAAATNVTVTNLLSTGLGFTSVTGSQGTAGHTGAVVWANLGTLNSGASAAVTLVTWAAQPGTVTNSATVSSAVTDPLKANNTASVKTTVTPQIQAQLNGSVIRIITPGTTGIVVESTGSLTPPVSWTPVATNPPPVLDLPITGGSQFFRVRPVGP